MQDLDRQYLIDIDKKLDSILDYKAEKMELEKSQAKFTRIFYTVSLVLIAISVLF